MLTKKNYIRISFSLAMLNAGEITICSICPMILQKINKLHHNRKSGFSHVGSEELRHPTFHDIFRFEVSLLLYFDI